MPERPDIVITGTGIITSLGRGRREVFGAVVAGRTGLGTMPGLEQSPEPDLGGGQAVDLDGPEAGGEFDEERACSYLRATIVDALREAGVTPGDSRRVSVVIGSTLHGMRAGGRYLRSGKLEDLTLFLAGPVLDRAIEGLGMGPIRMTTCAACSSGLSSVGLGMTLLRQNQTDVVVCGGYDTVSEYAYAGFNSLRLISPEALRPFGEDRQGMRVAEGYGALVLERAGEPEARGAKALAVVGGYGESSDSYHLTQPHPEGTGAAAAARQAIGHSSLTPGQIDLISAHATGTPHNDAAEYQALRLVFGSDLRSTHTVGLKGALGHTLGGAGAVELILSLEAMQAGKLPPTIGAGRTDPEFSDLSLTPECVPDATVRSTLNLSLGFGGSNTAVVLREPRPSRSSNANTWEHNDAVITGVGIVLPELIGFVEFAHRVASGDPITQTEIADEKFLPLLNARRLRRVSRYAKLSLASATDAVRHAGFDTTSHGDCSAILGTTHGSLEYCEKYYHQVVEEGMNAANPVYFAEGVPNAAAAHLSMGLELRGGCQTLIGTRTAGLEALNLAGLRVREGLVERCLVTAAEERSELADRAYLACDHSARPSASGAVSFLVESRSSAHARGATVLASLGDPVWGLGTACDEESLSDWLTQHPGSLIDQASHPAKSPNPIPKTARSVRKMLPELFSVTPLAAVATKLAQRSDGSVVSFDSDTRWCGLSLRGSDSTP